MIIRKANDVLKICEKENIPIWEVAVRYEMAESGLSRQEIVEKMGSNFLHMKASINAGLNERQDGVECKMFKDDAKKIMKYRETNKPLSGYVISKAVAYALSVMEINCSMGRVVAAPTAGASGVLPATIVSTLETLELGDDVGVNGLFTAGLVGIIIGKNASLSGAIGGCQAEIGSAAAMGAATAVEISGGTPKMAFDAAAIAIKSMMGLVCDPVAGLVEVPCAKRNGMGTSNALVAADMALAGISCVIPFDEVVMAMHKVGRSMPGSLKETAEGGVAVTPTGLRLKKEIFGE